MAYILTLSALILEPKVPAKRFTLKSLHEFTVGLSRNCEMFSIWTLRLLI